MFNRLIIAVLTLGLLLTFSSAAFCSNSGPSKEMVTYNHVSPVLEMNQSKVHAYSSAEALSRPSVDVPVDVPSALLPPQTFCDFIDYSGGAFTSAYSLPDLDYPIDYYMTRMSPEPGYVCSVMSISMGIYAPFFTGAPGMRVYLFDGARNKLDSVDFTNAELLTVGVGYATADFSTLNGGGPYTFVDGEDFYIGLNVIVNAPEDTLAFLAGATDTDVDGRVSFALWGGYYSWNSHRAFLMGAELCCAKIPYTSCYIQNGFCIDVDDLPYYNEMWYGELYGTKFGVDGPETLTEMGIGLCVSSLTEGTPDLNWYVMGVDGAGYPDMSNIMASGIVLNGDFVYLYDDPGGWITVDLSALNLVFNSGEEFFTVWECTTDPAGIIPLMWNNDWCLASYADFGGGWGRYGADWAMYAGLCKDEFNQCKTLSYYCNDAYGYPLPDDWNDYALYQRFTPAGEGCRLETARVLFADWGTAEQYTVNSTVTFSAADGPNGLPGTVLESFTLTPADYVIEPGWQTFDFTTLFTEPWLFDTDVWMGVECTDIAFGGVWLLMDDGSCPNFRSAENWDGDLDYFPNHYSSGFDPNFLMELDVCCIPFDERVCFAGDDWPVFGRDFARTGASFSSIGPDAQSNLSVAWRYANATTQTLTYNPPSIYGDTLVAYFGNEVVAVDMNDGSEIWAKPSDGFQIGAGGTITPTIYNFDLYGTTETYVFFGGADAKSFNCYDITDGSMVWTKNFMEHSLHFMSFAPNVIIDCAGVPVIIYADDDGDIYAREALTGNPFAGWTTNPINLGGAIHTNMATDGETVYVGTYASGVTPGTVFAFDGCTGATIWEFTEHQMDVIEPDNLDANAVEEFQSGIMYDNGTLFAPSTFDLKFIAAGNYVTGGGLMYSIDATDGAMNWVQIGRQVWDGIHLSLDANTVIVGAWNDWNSPGFHELCGIWAYNKLNGNIVYKHTQTSPGPYDLIGMGTALSCEQGEPDWAIATTRWNYVNFFRSTDGATMFHRRWTGYFAPNSYSYGHPSGQLITDGRLLLFGRQNLVCLTSADEIARPRLDINDVIVDVVVPFGQPDNTMVTVEGILGNTGGAPLTLDLVQLSPDDNGLLPDNSDISTVAVTSVDNNRLDRLDKMTRMYADAFADLSIADVPVNEVKSTRNNSAFAIPSWVYGVVQPTPGTVIPPQASYNDSTNYIDIVIEINGTLVPRGLTALFVDVYSDDPDYFIDSARGTLTFPGDTALYATPQVRVNLIGGCLYESATMEFGVGNANYAHVWNSTKLADGDITSMEIDGDGISFWQGSYVFSKAQDNSVHPVPPGKIAGLWSGHTFLHQDSWGGGFGWESILPDPNCYDATCAPNHRTNVLLGEMSHDDGANYDPVYGEVVAYAFVDSAQDGCAYDTLGNCTSWNWGDIDAGTLTLPYVDSLTVGFRGCVEVIGVYDEPDLANFMIHKMELSGRYAPINNLWIGAIIDYDIPASDFDVCNYDADHNLAYMYPCNTADNAWGVVRIPFGCGYEGMQGAKTVTAQQGGWSDTSVWLDSITGWMTGTVGLKHQPGTNPALCAGDADDREGWFVFGSGNLPLDGNGSFTLGAAWFGLPNATDADDASNFFGIADMANKWCGFGRGDVNNDGAIDLVDIAYLIDYVYYTGNGPFPFQHLGDVNVDGNIDGADVTLMVDYYFNLTGCIMGDWTIGGYTL